MCVCLSVYLLQSVLAGSVDTNASRSQQIAPQQQHQQPLPQQQQGAPHPPQSQQGAGQPDHGGRSQSHHHHAQKQQGASPAVSTTPTAHANDSLQTVQRLLTHGTCDLHVYVYTCTPEKNNDWANVVNLRMAIVKIWRLLGMHDDWLEGRSTRRPHTLIEISELPTCMQHTLLKINGMCVCANGLTCTLIDAHHLHTLQVPLSKRRARMERVCCRLLVLLATMNWPRFSFGWEPASRTEVSKVKDENTLICVRESSVHVRFIFLHHMCVFENRFPCRRCACIDCTDSNWNTDWSQLWNSVLESLVGSSSTASA